MDIYANRPKIKGLTDLKKPRPSSANYCLNSQWLPKFIRLFIAMTVFLFSETTTEFVKWILGVITYIWGAKLVIGMWEFYWTTP